MEYKRVDRIEATLWIDGQPKHIKRDNVKVTIVQPRNVKFHNKYWKLMEFTAFNAPEWTKLGSSDDVHELIKNRLGAKIYAPNGKLSHVNPYSISFVNMDQIQFEKHYSRALDICCKIIGVAPENVIRELAEFF